jgi:hypothetical protein
MPRGFRALPILAIISLASICPSRAGAQQIHRYPFETRDPVFIKGTADAPFQELVHDISDATSHGGQYSEHLQIASEQGNSIYYYYPTSRAPIGDDLNLSIWIKANRPGAQLAARLVLPKEHNPNNLDEPLTTILRGDVYQKVSRWQQLELRRPTVLAKNQQKLVREQLKRDVDFTDAYIDRILINAYSGPGMTELWIDDLEIGPVVDAKPFQTTAQDKNSPVKLDAPSAGPPRPVNRSINVEQVHDKVMLNGKPIIFRAIRYTDTPLNVIRETGLNAIMLDSAVTPAVLDEATRLGFWLIPMLNGNDDATSMTTDRLRQVLGRFLDKDAVLAWYLAGGLRAEEIDTVAKLAQGIRAIDPNRPQAADLLDDYRGYSRHIDLEGASRWPLFTTLELTSYRDWLNQRRLLGRGDGFFWTWLQTHMPEWYSTLVYERPTAAGFDDPVGPQPEQIRLLTYIALASGCHGIAYWSDRFLADSHQGRDRLLELALLNLELKMLEDLLVTAGPPQWIDTSEPEVKAAVMRTTGGLLVLPMWLGKGAQCVPGQSAKVNLKLTVPQAPVGTQPWEISPGQVRSLVPERIPGGTTITIPEFGLTTAIIFTADNGPNGLVVRFQEKAKQNGKLAAGYANQLAEESLRKTNFTYEKLVAGGHALPDGTKLLDDARTRIKSASESYDRGQYREAYAEADRALRPLRILMRAEWTQAIRGLSIPASSPYAMSYYTLPQHFKLVEAFKAQAFGANLLPDGDFEAPADKAPKGWLPQEMKLDEVDFVARRTTDIPHLGRQCLMLQVNPKNPQEAPATLERCYLGIHSPDVSQPPGTWVRISVWVRIPKTLVGSVDGALIYDSAGGEPLAVRLNDAMPWTEYTSYRRVPPSGKIHVTLALSALGSAYFDDVRIEPLLGGSPKLE